MSFKDTLRNKLSSELFTQVVDALGDDFDFDVVPRSRLNKVIKQRNDYKEQLETLGGSQTEGKDEGEDDDSAKNPKGNPAQPSAQPSQQQQINEEELRKQFAKEKDDAILALKIQYAGLDALRNAGSVDPDLAYTLLDTSKLTLDDKGKVAGIAEQIESLKASKSYLFGGKPGGRDGTPGGTGKEGGTGKFEKVTTKDDFLKLSTTDQASFKEAHPDVFKRFLNEF